MTTKLSHDLKSERSYDTVKVKSQNQSQRSKSKTYIGSQVKRQNRLPSQRPVKVRGDFQVRAQYKSGDSQVKVKVKQVKVKVV